VVVIGAGLAGLRAAEILVRAGRAVTVLEARNVPGGRVRTLRAPFTEALFGEAGPIRISARHRLVLDAVREHQLEVVPFASVNGDPIATLAGRSYRLPKDIDHAGEALNVRQDERGVTPAALLERYVGELPASLGRADADAYGEWASFDAMTWPGWLRSRGASDGAVTLMTLGGDSRRLSALYILRQYALLRGEDQFYKIAAGMDQLPTRMAARLGTVVQYDSAVTAIDWSPQSATVRYQTRGAMREIEARHVIVTLPLSVLRQMQITPTFSAARQASIAGLVYFPAVRFLLQAQSRFWHAAELSGTARTDLPCEIWDSTYDLPGDAGILGATVGGAVGAELLKKSNPEALHVGMDAVAAAFPELRSAYESGAVTRWGAEPWARGAFAVYEAGQMARLAPAMTKPEGVVHFAGEHTSAWMGWMEGALESGERTAKEVLSA
jgi:monoamine oxidase